MALKPKVLLLVWSKSILLVTFLFSVVLGYYTHKFIRVEKINTVVDLFSLLPFTAVAYIGGIIYISFSISSMKGLSVSEREKIKASLFFKRRKYTVVGLINLIAGLFVILLYIFTDSTNILKFVIACAIYFAVCTIILCVLEQMNLNSFKQHISERKN